MRGFIDSDTGRPMLDLEVQFRTTRCLIDTGFTGEITMGSDIAERLKLRHEVSILKTLLADGSSALYRRARCEILWFGIYRTVQAQVFMGPRGDSVDAIIGTGMLTPYILVADFNHGTVEIRNPVLLGTLP